MSAALAEPPRKTWTRAEVEALEAAGLLAGTRLELIEGELFDKMGQNPPHASAICRLVVALASVFGLNRVRTQLPVEPADDEIPYSQPEPDIAVTKEREPAYRTRHPRADDVLLIAEVADSTYDYDTKRKANLYARASFVEYIVLDLNHGQLLVFKAPRNGVYTESHVLRPGDLFVPTSAPNAGLAVSELLFGDDV